MENLLHSNFNSKIQDLKIQELLSNVQVHFEESDLHRIKKTLEQENVSLIGSYLLETSIKTRGGTFVDLLVQMDASCFQKKDFRNHRYSLAKNEKVAQIKERLEASFTDYQVLTTKKLISAGREVDTALVLRRGNESIRILIGIPADTFTTRKLAPGRNNLKKDNPNQKSTPYYNQAILADTGYITHLNFLHFYCKQAHGFRNAVKLGKVWIQQKLNCTGFSGFIFSMLLAYLLQDNSKKFRIPKETSDWQMFKVMMEFLAKNDFINEAVVMTLVHDQEEFTVLEFMKHYDVVILDPTGLINIGAGLTISDMEHVKFEAKRNLALLNAGDETAFQEIFLNSHNSILKFDHYAKMSSLQLNMPAYTADAQVDFPSPVIFALRYIPKVLKKALKDRVELISITASRNEKKNLDEFDINIGLVLNSEIALREVEQGPPSDDTAAVESFRRIWGEKAEMRRFKDGSILESVVFSSDGSFEDRAYVLQKMVIFLIKRHMGVALQEGKSYFSNPFFKLLKAPGMDLATQKSFGMVTEAFATLSKQLRSLKELPLDVTSVKMSHPALYFCSAIVPQPHPDEHTFNNGYRPFIECMDVVIELEKSGHWPDNLLKIQQMKMAFYLKIAQSLTSLYPETVCRVSIGERDNVMSCGWIDVTVSTGYKFRCRIHSEREKYLLDQEKESQVTVSKAMYERIYVHLPLHSSKLYNLCLNYPFLPVTIRIMKRWIGVHLLSNHVSDQVIELLCAFVFVQTGTLAAPGSSCSAFFRVLNLLATHDWKSDPLIIELKKGEITEELKTKILSKFKSFKKDSIYIATEDDPEAVIYPRIKPIIINRLKALSVSCIKIMDRFPSEHNLSRVILFTYQIEIICYSNSSL